MALFTARSWFSRRSASGRTARLGLGALSAALAVALVTGGLGGCTEDGTTPDGSPSITVAVSTSCGSNVLPVSTVDDLIAGTIVTANVIITGYDPASASRSLVGDGGEPVPVTISLDEDSSEGAGYFISSRDGARFGTTSKNITFGGATARDQFFCTSAGTVNVTALVENYKPGGTGVAIPSITPLRSYPIRCVSPDQFFRECGVVDASVPFDLGGDAGDGGTEDMGDGGQGDGSTTDMQIIAPWTISFQPLAGDENAVIAVRGSGGVRPDTVDLKFKVAESGVPVPRVKVDFTLTSAAGGVQLLPVTAFTDEFGIASTRLVAGTIPGTVQVKATATRGEETGSDFSRAIIIRGGIPSARVMQLTCDNDILAAFRSRKETPDLPDRRYFYDIPAHFGTTCRISMGDRLQGRLDSDTRVFFRTEAGTVDQELAIDGTGEATMTHNIGNPAPVDVEPADYEAPYTTEGDEVIMNPRDGLVRIIAFTRGEEDFVDNNANGIFDPGTDSQLPGMDLPEPFVDADDDGTWTRSLPTERPGDVVSEQFQDTNQDRVWTPPNRQWDANGEIWTSTTVVWAGNAAEFRTDPADTHLNGYTVECNAAGGCTADPQQAPNPLCANVPGALYGSADLGIQFGVTARLRDHNGNCVPSMAGTGRDIDTARHAVEGLTSPGIALLSGRPTVFLRDDNCFEGFEHPGGKDVSWYISMTSFGSGGGLGLATRDFDIATTYARITPAGLVETQLQFFSLVICF